MTIAEIHGKISSRGSNLSERLEDLLTSDVFSACKYLPNQNLLHQILTGAMNCRDSADSTLNLPKTLSAHYHFWPRSRVTNREPDLFLELEHPGSAPSLILIEAKYFSGMSDAMNIEEEKTKDEENKAEGRQLFDQRKMLDNPREHFGHLLKLKEFFVDRAYFYFVDFEFADNNSDSPYREPVILSGYHQFPEPHDISYWISEPVRGFFNHAKDHKLECIEEGKLYNLTRGEKSGEIGGMKLDSVKTYILPLALITKEEDLKGLIDRTLGLG